MLHIFQVQQLSGDEVKDEAAPHRFSAVIEKIERLYMVALIYEYVIFWFLPSSRFSCLNKFITNPFH